MQEKNQTKLEDCFIERQIEKIINYVKSHKLLFMVTFVANLSMMSFVFVIWYLYSNSLPKLDNTDKLSAVFNFFIALGTIMLAIFAWIAFKYAITLYGNQKKIDYGLNSVKNARALIAIWSFGIIRFTLAQNKLLTALQKKSSHHHPDRYNDVKKISEHIFKNLYNKTKKEYSDKFISELIIVHALFPDLKLKIYAREINNKLDEIYQRSKFIANTANIAELADLRPININVFKGISAELSKIFKRLLEGNLKKVIR